MNTITIKSLEEIKNIITGDPRLLIQYNIIKNAIPLDIKGNLIIKYNEEHFKQALELKQNTNKRSKDLERIMKMTNRELRKLIAKNETVRISGKELWKKRLNIDITNHYSIAKQATKESRLRILHFKLLHNIYPTNITLFRMGVKESDKCETCDVKDFH